MSLLLLIILPGGLAGLVAVCSLAITLRAFGPLQALLCAVTLMLTVSALFILWRMMVGAWPTYLPYVFIAGSIALVLVQRHLFNRRWTAVGRGAGAKDAR